MGAWIVSNARVCSLIGMVSVALFLLTIVMVTLLDFVLRVEEVEDHWLDGLLLLRVPHLLNLIVELGHILLGKLLPLLHSQVTLEHHLLHRVVRLHVFFCVAAARPECAPILPNWEPKATLLAVRCDRILNGVVHGVRAGDEMMVACPVHILAQVIYFPSLIVLNQVVSLKWWRRYGDRLETPYADRCCVNQLLCLMILLELVESLLLGLIGSSLILLL